MVKNSVGPLKVSLLNKSIDTLPTIKNKKFRKEGGEKEIFIPWSSPTLRPSPSCTFPWHPQSISYRQDMVKTQKTHQNRSLPAHVWYLTNKVNASRWVAHCWVHSSTMEISVGKWADHRSHRLYGTFNIAIKFQGHKVWRLTQPLPY